MITSFRGENADEVIKAQDAHLKEAVADGDDSHRDALRAMKSRWKRPLSGMKWYKSTKHQSPRCRGVTSRPQNRVVFVGSPSRS